jgi:hypothetical protein
MFRFRKDDIKGTKRIGKTSIKTYFFYQKVFFLAFSTTLTHIFYTFANRIEDNTSYPNKNHSLHE